jgi:hypothetical protein
MAHTLDTLLAAARMIGRRYAIARKPRYELLTDKDLHLAAAILEACREYDRVAARVR